MKGWHAKCSADLTHTGLDKDGNLQLTFTVSPADKYTIMPISDIRGRKFSLFIKTASQRVFAGPEGIEEARARVQGRKDARDA